MARDLQAKVVTNNNPEAKQVTNDISSLATVETSLGRNYLSKEVFDLVNQIALTIKVSEALPETLKGNPSNIALQLLTGYEMGMQPMRSIQGLYIVKGSVNVWGKETVRRIREHGFRIQYKDETLTECTAVVSRVVNGELEEYTETFKLAYAVASGWCGKDVTYNKEKGTLEGNVKVGWQAGQNRKLKMRYVALSTIIKSYIPEVLGAANDIQEVAEDYTPISEPIEVTPTSVKPEERRSVTVNSLQNFLSGETAKAQVKAAKQVKPVETEAVKAEEKEATNE